MARMDNRGLPRFAAAKPGETLSEFTGKELGDATWFRELLDGNEEVLDDEAVFEDTLLEALGNNLMRIPGLSDLLPREARVFGQVRSVVSTATSYFRKVADFLPPELSGYSADALSALDGVNGVLGGLNTTNLPSLLPDLIRGDMEGLGLGFSKTEWLLGESPRSQDNTVEDDK